MLRAAPVKNCPLDLTISANGLYYKHGDNELTTAEAINPSNLYPLGAFMPCTTDYTCPSCQTTITENDLGYFHDNNQNFVCEGCFYDKFITEQYKLDIANGLLSLIEKIDSGKDSHQAICEVVPAYNLNTHQTNMVIWEYNKMIIEKNKA